jgi:hypothetical protein
MARASFSSKNFPVCTWPPRKIATAYFDLGTRLGYPVSQNGRRHIMGHVKDLGEDAQQTDKVHIYRMNANIASTLTKLTLWGCCA